MSILEKIPEPIMEYWPYILGGIIGLYLISRYVSSSNSGSSDVAAFYNAQAQGAALANQSKAQLAQIEAVNNAQARSDAIEQNKINAQAQVAYLGAQSGLASAVGKATSEMTAALYAPTIQAIGSATYENSIVMQSAVEAAASSYATQAAIIDSTAKSSAAYAEAAANTWQGVGSAMPKIW